MKGLVVALLFNLMVQQSSQQEVLHHNIYIDPDTGDDSPECHTQNSTHSPCRSLNFAFEYINNSTQYNLRQHTNYTLTRNVTFEGLSTIAIVGGNGSVIQCSGNNVGFAFLDVSVVSLTDVAVMYCSATRNSTSRNISSIPEFQLYTFHVALYFSLCQNVTMRRVDVSFSPDATGVVMYDTVGTNLIQDSIFTNNNVSTVSNVSEMLPGGGGFYVEFTFCFPGDNHCTDESDRISRNYGVTYIFEGCSFANNSASNAGTNHKSTYIVPYRSTHQAFGRGGGLSIFVKGSAQNNVFRLISCRFERNLAQWGAGLFVEFHDETANNSVSIENCTFLYNKCNFTLKTGTGGGGMRLGHYVYNISANGQGNRVGLSNCTFTNNSAMYGGGISISPTLQNTTTGSEAEVRLSNLIFHNNTGKNGAAVHIGLFPLITTGITMKAVIANCSFLTNDAQYADLLKKDSSPHMVGVGTVYLCNVPADFQGVNRFEGNKGTALATSGNYLNFTDSKTIFRNNIGYRGGGISLLGSSYMLVDANTQLVFKGNMATDQGGAIYNRYVEMDNLMTHSNCFVRHTNPYISPDNWTSVFHFAGNLDLHGEKNNAIHTSSILPCAWAGGNGYIDTERILCWNNWTYYSDTHAKNGMNCSYQISSEAGNITKIKDVVRAAPGQKFSIPLKITDDYKHDLVGLTVLSTTNATVNRTKYFSGGVASLNGPENSHTKLNLETVGDRIWKVSLEAQLTYCPPGSTLIHPNNSDTYCSCSSDQYLGKVFCNSDKLEIKMKDQNWIGQLNDSAKYLLGACPPSFCKKTESSFNILPSNTDNATILSDAVCNSYRTGILCGECKNNYGPSVNSRYYDCVNCTNISLSRNIVKYLASTYLPLAIAFTVVIVCDIRLTTGPANAFIVYAQVVSSIFSLDADGQVRTAMDVDTYQALLKGYRVVYGVFNLEFVENLLSPFCLSSQFTTLSVLLLDYGIAIFPLVMILIAVASLRLKECFSCIAGLCFKVKKYNMSCRRINEALLPAFAAFILLSYTKLSLTSSYISSTQPLIDESGNKTDSLRVYFAGYLTIHDPHYRYRYLLPSIVITIFVCAIPLLLLQYPLRGLEWIIFKVPFLRKLYPTDKVHVFLDTFQGCYRNRMRFFAGVYFLFRLILNVIYVATGSWLQQYIAQQIVCIIMITLIAICRPYNRDYWIFNYVDVLMFANLATINAFTLYLYSQNGNADQVRSLSPFILQYVLVFLL